MLSLLARCANEQTEQPCRPRRGARYLSPTIVAVMMLSATMATSARDYGGIQHYLSQTAQSRMKHVAVKVAELDEKKSGLSVRGLDFSPNDDHIAVRSAYSDINIWNWRSRRIETTVETPRGFESGSSFNPIQYSADGRMLAVCEGKGAGNVVMRVWNTSDWSLIRDVVDDGMGGCRSIAFTPDGKLLIYAMFRIRQTTELIAYSTDSWRLAWRIPLGVWPRINIEPEGLAVSPNGRQLAVSAAARIVTKAGVPPSYLPQMNQEEIVDIIDLSTREIVRTCRAHVAGSIAWNPAGSRIALAGGGFEIFDAASGRPTTNQSMPESAHMSVRFTPDGRYLIESDSNGRGTGLGVGIWDITGRELLQRVSGDSASIAVSHDDKFLAIGGIGHTTIWQFK